MTKIYLDGIDIQTVFGISIESGTDDFLKYPAKKDSITHDWQDANGLDVDLTKMFFNARNISLRCNVIVDNEEQFWQNYQSFLAQLAKPGYRRIQVSQFGEKSFYCYYKECTSFTRFTRIKDNGLSRIGCKFTLNLVEGEPNIDYNNVFIVDEQGRFLVS
ncbi:hypothetical protein QTN47_27405 [Danxiaibacter flavus]|uniref:Phage tail protein n=1 Tax=Danxiaibacter flavus TaxID=3049108 RepID=A0ABV3ZN70_9BACT|nr:hypothetical protein QNM32_27405 [Chitinophagaceae bacterium DXS]